MTKEKHPAFEQGAGFCGRAMYLSKLAARHGHNHVLRCFLSVGATNSVRPFRKLLVAL